jgi:hypothetical protein
VGNALVGRDERVFYVFPGATTQIPEIAEIGTTGGLGFTVDGVIEVGADSFYASARSILNPEENAGQDLSTTNVGPLNILSLEDAFCAEEGGVALVEADYIAFKRQGIIALRFKRSFGFFFQSDITSVDPTLSAVLASAKRRFMADFIIDTLANLGLANLKKLGTPNRIQAIKSAAEGFLRLLLSPGQPETQRISAFSVVDDTTIEQRELGIQRYDVRVRLLNSLDFIVFRTEVGETVSVEEVA